MQIPRILMVSLLLLAAAPAPARPEEVRESHYLMGTLLEVTIEAPTREKGQDLIRDGVEIVRRLEQEFTDYDDTSDLMRLNHRAGQGAVAVPLDLYRLLSLCQLMTRATGGAFDATVGPLLQLRRSAAAAGRVPTDEEVDAAFALVGADKMTLLPPDRVELPRRGMALDLGGIGKGYALERMAALLREAGVRKALLNFGGSSILAIGPPEDEPAWPIWVPRGNAMAGSVTLRNRSLSTSQSLRRDDDKAQTGPHIVDPRSGRWIEADRQATVVAIDAAIAEGWSKALIVDPEGALDILAESRDVEGIVFDEHGEHRTPRFDTFASWKPVHRGGRDGDDKPERPARGAAPEQTEERNP